MAMAWTLPDELAYARIDHSGGEAAVLLLAQSPSG
jgi:hypothetical protein